MVVGVGCRLAAAGRGECWRMVECFGFVAVGSRLGVSGVRAE